MLALGAPKTGAWGGGGWRDRERWLKSNSSGGDLRVSCSSRAVLRSLRAYSVVKHVGRRSGREYQTPVGAYPLGDGFVVAILYGSDSQWVRNAFATGGFTLRTKGRDYPLERPEIIPSARALPAYPRIWRWTLKRQKIEEFVWAHRATPAPGGVAQ